MSDSGIDLRAEQELGGLEIEMTNRPSEVAGSVTTRDGNTAPDYVVVLFARDRSRWGPGSRYVASGRLDQNGRYRVRGLPAGDYCAIAIDQAAQDEWADPDFPEGALQSAAAVSLADGETTSVDLVPAPVKRRL
jgi:hypothetical protein